MFSFTSCTVLTIFLVCIWRFDATPLELKITKNTQFWALTTSTIFTFSLFQYTRVSPHLLFLVLFLLNLDELALDISSLVCLLLFLVSHLHVGSCCLLLTDEVLSACLSLFMFICFVIYFLNSKSLFVWHIYLLVYLQSVTWLDPHKVKSWAHPSWSYLGRHKIQYLFLALLQMREFLSWTLTACSVSSIISIWKGVPFMLFKTDFEKIRLEVIGGSAIEGESERKKKILRGRGWDGV